MEPWLKPNDLAIMRMDAQLVPQLATIRKEMANSIDIRTRVKRRFKKYKEHAIDGIADLIGAIMND